MKKTLVITLLCLLVAGGLGACAAFSPPTQTPAPTETPTPTETPAPTETPVADGLVPAEEPAAGSLRLELQKSLTETAENGAFAIFGESFDGVLVCPEGCRFWEQDGKLHFEPEDYFARIMISGLRKDAPDAPRRLEDMLDTEKWRATADSTVVGDGRRAFCMRHLKYDTYRYWLVWETETHYVMLYGACFDYHIDDLCALMDTVAASFRSTEEFVRADCAPDDLLLTLDGATLRYDGVSLEGSGEMLMLTLCFCMENPGDREKKLIAEGDCAPGSEKFVLPTDASGLWSVRVPLIVEGKRQQTLSLALRSADGEGESLPVAIEWK
ncbi:MAG: hypothetical protein IKI69_07310 [Oscillospiraceae bacterium]|nr:hypothetical protein [Oscillospiraceae bacterium]